MIAATGIQDQELAIAAKRSGVNNPTVAWRGNLRVGMSRDRLAPLGSTHAIGRAEVADFRAVNRQPQPSAQSREGYRRRKPARILERRERRAGCIFFDRTRLRVGVARRRIER